MSADTPIKQALKVQANGDEATYILPYTEELAQQTALKGVSTKVEPTPDPAPDDEAAGSDTGGGIIRRANEFRTRLGPVALESVGLHGMELAKANAKRADELYRNKFPRLEPQFTRKCQACETEFDEDVDVCEACGEPTREPSHEQRTDAEAFFDSVNKEDQPLRQLYEFLATDAGRLGVWLHVVRQRYELADVITGEVDSEPIELVRGDPKRIKPVVDENGRIGGHWWMCPFHRDPNEFDLREEPGRCHRCPAQLREVFYAEVESLSDDEPEKVYFEDEVIDHAPFIPLLAGKDGISPLANLWLKQAILWWMDLYAAGYYDQENTNRYPGKMVIIHTSNKQAFEKQLAKAQDEEDEDKYAQGFVYNEVPFDGETDQAQVIDMMNDEILGQSDAIKKDYKSDIRSVYGLTDAQDSELEDAGGLNNEGLQLEINDRDKASAQQDLKDGPLRKLMRVLGYTDWEITFVPPEREEEELSELETVQAAATAKQNGIPYEITDGRFEIVDTDGPADVDDAPDGAPGADDGDDEDAPTEVQPVSPGDVLDQEARSRSADDPAVDQALATLAKMQRDLCWPDAIVDGELTQQAREPFFADDEDMPEFVKELIQQALRSGSVYLGEYEAPNVTGQAVKAFFREKLNQPQGWSIESLSRDFADRFHLDLEDAVSTIRTQLTSALNEARYEGYQQQGALDERRFKVVGPIDDNKTDASWELLEATNPRFGGTPRRLNELRELFDDVREEYFPEFSGGAFVAHYNERDTVVEHFD